MFRNLTHKFKQGICIFPREESSLGVVSRYMQDISTKKKRAEPQAALLDTSVRHFPRFPLPPPPHLACSPLRSSPLLHDSPALLLLVVLPFLLLLVILPLTSPSSSLPLLLLLSSSSLPLLLPSSSLPLLLSSSLPPPLLLSLSLLLLSSSLPPPLLLSLSLPLPSSSLPLLLLLSSSLPLLLLPPSSSLSLLLRRRRCCCCCPRHCLLVLGASSLGVSFSPGGGIRAVSKGSMGGLITKTNHDKCRGSCFVTHLMGLPLPGPPLVYLHPQNLCRARTNRPHPSEKGMGWSAGFRASALAGGVVHSMVLVRVVEPVLDAV